MPSVSLSGGPAYGPIRQRPPRDARGSTVLPVPAAPATPNTPSPADTATAYYTLLSWVSARATKFDIFLDTVNPPVAPAVSGHYVGTSFVPTLLPGTTYYWQIVAINDGGSATGPVWSFTTPRATAVLFSLAGAIVTSRARFGSATIHDVLNAAPNTANLTFGTAAPAAGQAVQIGLGTLDPARLLFGGEIQSVDQSYVDTTLSTLWPVNLIDYTFRLNKRRPFGTYVNVSASIIARALVTSYASGFTAAHVQDGLPAVSINFDGSADFMSCLTTLAQAASTTGAPVYTYVDYAKDLHLYTTEAGAAPTPLTLANPPLNDPSPIVFSTDLSQIRTKVFGKGHSETVPTNVAAGETIVPLPDVSLFTATGGQAIAATQSNGAQTEIVSYGGVQLGGGGTLVGPGAAPSVAPNLALVLGSGLGTGWYGYAVVDHTAAGPSLPSPIGTILTNGAAAATDPATFTGAGTNYTTDTNGLSMANGWTLRWAFTFRRISDGAETLLSPLFGGGPNGAVTNYAIQFDLTGCSAPPSGYVRQWYRTANNGATFLRIPVGTGLSFAPTFLSGTETGGFFTDHTPDGLLGAAAPASNNTGPQLRVSVTAIAIGPLPTTSRDVYRTAAQASQAAALTAQLKLLTTLADNTTTTYADSTADGSLGANAPTSDTSGLTQPAGQVNAGSTTLLTASAGPFQPNGGWALLGGGQVVRYTGITGNTLTGIPASGAGAITTTVLYGSQALPSPALTGINNANGLLRAMVKGAAVAIWVQRDDLAAQAALGLLELDEAGLPTDGIREYTITDGRYGEPGLTALCDADLALFSRPIVSVSYYTRDPNARSGQTIAIALPTGFFDPAIFDPAIFDDVTTWGLAGSFVIQDVTITFDGVAMMPLRFVRASSVKFSLLDLLRRVPLN